MCVYPLCLSFHAGHLHAAKPYQGVNFPYQHLPCLDVTSTKLFKPLTQATVRDITS